MTTERRDFLVELGTEELPPRALRQLEQAFASGIQSGLAQAGLGHGAVQSFATPRRLAVLVRRLVTHQPEQSVKRRGPPVAASFDAAGHPTRAALAFADSCGATVDTLQRLNEGKGEFLFYIGTKPGSTAAALLPGIVQAALDALPIPKRMRWGDSEAQFVRPVHWLILLHGKDVVPARILDAQSGSTTRGHRFLAPKPIRVASPATYARVLRERGHVLADFGERRALIRERVNERADQIGGRALISENLLDEVTALVEWPVPLAGRFEDRFLQLPREVLISTLQDHQRYFAVEDTRGALLPWFITVSNIESRDESQVRAGNERVVRPRLADAAFFWEQDRRQPLGSRRAALDAVTFQTRLGSLGDKARRVRTLAGEIAAARSDSASTNGADPGGERTLAERAADLCKCDLLTAMVGEFPELQGIMGRYYALADGEAAEVADAIREHYLPRGAGDELPATRSGVAVAIADRIDTLAGIFAIGQKPTGTKDPFGLRRAAIGVLRILIEKNFDLDLRSAIDNAVQLALTDIAKTAAAAGFKATPVVLLSPDEKPDRTADEVYDYIIERLRAYYLEGAGSGPSEGRAAVAGIDGQSVINTEMFDAVVATRPRSPLDFDARLRALGAFLELPESASLTAANKRIANILRKAGDPAAEEFTADIDVQALREPAEIRLFDSMHALRDTVAGATARREYGAALGQLAQLRPAVDAFFDQVMVMDEDPRRRANRLALLAQLRGLFGGIADLSRLPG
jgi:glycyl-tRNA synthetase beta chain